MDESKYPKLENKEWLRTKYIDEDLTMKEISDILGCGDSTVSNWIQQHGLEKGKKGKVTVTCDYCGSNIHRYPSQTNEMNFCDYDCQGEWRAENQTGSNNPRWKGKITLECEWCGDTWESTRTEAHNGFSTFCSRQCQLDWLRSRSGEKAPAWKGGYEPYYGENWLKQRRKALERDNYQCRVCGIDNEKLDRELSVHHIQPLRTFDDPEDANKLDNLVTLCNSCHNEWEGIPLKPQ